ncbi:peptide chain release factor aRF-1 [Candidatus Woesearchaeota archaeon]|nr:peptide chain release factor aRF-1 [Candidatus Woesearchaeota archaeon]
MSLKSRQIKQIKKFVEELEQYRGRHTELVSVYVPSGYDLNKVINQLSQEQGTATNIKSTSTRKNVIDALEKMIQHLKLYTRTPENGMAAFSGNVSDREGQSDVRVWSFDPPVPINLRIYRCDKEFVLDPIREMAESKEIYGLVVLDRREATIGILKGKSIIPLANTKSNVPGKTRAGGQSAHRFERLREGAALDFYKKVAEYMKSEFLGNSDIKGILLGGPGPTKHQFLETGDLTNDVKKKIIAVKDITYTDQFGLNELLEKCEDVLADDEIAEEKKLVSDFLHRLATKPNSVTYGKDQVMEKLKIGAVDRVLISEDIDDVIIDNFEDEAEKVGTTVFQISKDTREGAQLYDIGGYAAILRYEDSS